MGISRAGQFPGFDIDRQCVAWKKTTDRHGYFLPSEGESDWALALFSFESLAGYEQYGKLFGVDPEFVAADRIGDESGCVIRYERSFMRPLLPGDVSGLGG